MAYSTREVPLSASDFDLFGQDISPADYEFFKKHTGAFKRMLQDQSKEKKQSFVDAFREFSLRNGCLKDCSGKNDGRLVYIDEAALFYKENFVNGKFSTAKNIVMDAVTLAQNKHLLPNMGAKSYSKDPFFHKETRDVFRRLFGLPSLNITFMKVICILPLHIKFGGSLCRYLRRWLEAEPIKVYPPQPVKPPKTTSKKKEKDTKAREEHIFKHEGPFKMDRCTCDIHQITDIPGLPGIRAVLETTDVFHCGKKEIPEEKPAKKESAKEKGPVLSAYVVGAFSNNKDKDVKTSFQSIDKNGSTSQPDERKKTQQTIDLVSFLTNEKKSSYSSCNEEKRKTSGSLLDEGKRKKNSLFNEEKKKSSNSLLDEDKKKKSSSTLKNDLFQVKKERFSEDISGESSSETDDSLEEIKKMLLLDKPHPNEQFEQLLGKPLSKEHEKKLKKCKESAEKMQRRQNEEDDLISIREKILAAEAEAILGRPVAVGICNGFVESSHCQEILKERENKFPEFTRGEEEEEKKKKKRHACANCRKVEPEPKTFKKCQRCRGKRTRFYCSRSCQEFDWASHREDHNSIEDVT